ncbi:vesicle transport through interaction with t-SNAREs 1a [Arctopsyche grandis]|uniref:vesicle transport through interaction with t-SNAREs 1a n=1 Tax=Arctopsyche grandis TaxID=121162 RepID=UPI00406D6F6B
MTSLIESYEQQYSVLTAEITAEIGKFKVSKPEDRRKSIPLIEKCFEDANDLLEQLELEIRGTSQSHLINRLACYRAELSRIKNEFQTARQNAPGDSSGYGEIEEYYEEWNVAQEQKAKLLQNSDRIEKTGKKLTEGYRVLLESEQLGAAVLNDLNSQRETIQRSRNRLRETDEHLSRSSRIMNSMIMRTMQQKFILIVFSIIFIIIISVAIYLSIK